MAFVSVLDSLGKSGLLDAFNQLLEKILIDGVVSAGKATQLLATHLGKGDASRIVRDIYADADVNQSTLLKLFCKLFADNLKLQNLDLLNTKLVDLKPTNKNHVVLKLPSLAVEIDTLSSSSIDLLISTSADLAINVQGYSSLPGNDARNPDTLCIGVLGDLAGGISLAMSHAAVMLKLGAGNHFSHTINYYLSGSHEETLGEKAMCGLGLISCHPDLSISSLISMLSNPVNRCTAVEVISSQEWRLSAEIKLAREFRAGSYTSLDAGIGINYTRIEHGEYHYAMSLDPDDSRRLLVSIRKLKSNETITGETFGAEIDLRGIADKIYPRIQDHLGRAGKMLVKLLDVLPLESSRRQLLAIHIDGAIERFAHSGELLAVLGIDPGMTPQQRICSRLCDFIENSPSFWSDKTHAATKQVLEEVSARLAELGLTTRVNNKLVEALQSPLQKALSKIDKEFRQRLQHKLSNRTERERLLEALHLLDDAGKPLKAITEINESSVNTISKQIRTHVGRYQKFIAGFCEHLSSVESRRISLRASSEVKQLSSAEAEIRLSFNPDTPRADEYLHKLLLSDVEEVFRVACHKDRLAAVMEVDASLARYEKFTHKRTTDIILFGFEIGSSSILDVDTRFVENRDGNLTIIGKMSYEEVSKSLFDRRQFNIVNLHQLSNAMQTGSATLSFSASQSGDGVDEDAIRMFIRDVVRLEMVDPHDLAMLDGVFQQAGEIEGGKHSRFLFGLSLSEAELKQLLSYGAPVWSDTRIPGVMQQICRPSAPQAVLKPEPPWAGDDGFDIYTHSPSSTRARIRPLRRGDTISIACDAIDSALKDVPKVFKTKNRLEHLFKRLRYKGSIGDAIRDYRPQKFVPPSLDYDEFPGSAENRDEQWLYFRNKAVVAFADEALLNMWAVYHSAPYSWKIERYQFCQRRTAEVISYWFDRTETHAWKIPLPGIRSEMRPMTIAMLKMLLDLADTNGDKKRGPFLSMELQILDDRAKIIKRLPISN
ncbi:MAG: hypothetical protein U9Q75_05110 [Pseudomonadota bacterium]|nr:hypothetical protein [Pseudomonadota bacterium]